MKIPFALILAIAAFSAYAKPDGATLFAQRCAACHGEKGTGGVGVPLALPGFLTTVSNEYLRTTIHDGRPGRVMPSFSQLSDAEVTAIIGFIRSWMPAGQAVPAEDRRPVTGNKSRGRELFAKNCAMCHGDHGQGGPGTGVTFSRPRNLPIIPPALNNEGFLHAASDGMIRETLRKGRSGTPMISFLERGLTEKDIDDIVAYVRSFQEHPLHFEAHPDESPYLVYDSPYNLQDTITALKRAAIGKNFRIIREQNLDYGLFPADKENPKQRVLYFCNFNFVDEAMKLDPRVGMFMPCRITAVEHEDGSVTLMSINPRFLAQFFNNSALDKPCRQMYDTYVAMMEEATL